MDGVTVRNEVESAELTIMTEEATLTHHEGARIIKAYKVVGTGIGEKTFLGWNVAWAGPVSRAEREAIISWVRANIPE